MDRIVGERVGKSVAKSVVEYAGKSMGQTAGESIGESVGESLRREGGRNPFFMKEFNNQFEPALSKVRVNHLSVDTCVMF